MQRLDAVQRRALRLVATEDDQQPSSPVTFLEHLRDVSALVVCHKAQTDGFFVEAGAADGELLSNTLFLERRLGWRGLLVEAFPGTYNELLFKRRKAYSLQAALSPTNVSKIVNFKTGGTKGVIGRIVANSAFGVTVEAFPLYAILQALNVTVIDFLSLDVEGFELKVLKTVPWDKIKVRLMTVEWLHIPGGFKPLKDFMTSKGYRLIRATGLDAWFGLPELLDKPTKKY
ncbi:hypothetical protein O3P69_009189 [Scylla paramamosain]|uniref:Methyltransferase FkbM domain-containing protein n=1 Tax=Scylla paramamosain TaxID=85552 RepID=A0AAW0TAP0_SCYPA